MSFLLHIVILIGGLLPGVLAYNVIFGKGKILHFGPIGVALATAYAVFLTLNATGNEWLALGAGLLMAVLISALFAWIALRLDPDGLGILSIALHLAILSVVLNWTGLTRGALGLPRIPRWPFPESQLGFAAVMIVIGILWVIAMLLLDRSRFGRQLQALAEQEWTAGSIGIRRWMVHTEPS